MLSVRARVFGSASVFVGVFIAGSAPPQPAAIGGDRGGSRLFSCITIVEPGREAEGTAYCDRLAEQWAQRPELTAAQRAAAEPEAERVRIAIGRSLMCPGVQPGTPECFRDFARERPGGVDALGQDDVAAARRGLDAAGFPDATVRIAGRRDPAIAGSLFYVVSLFGGACAIGHLRSHTGGGGHSLMARLPNGRCW